MKCSKGERNSSLSKVCVVWYDKRVAGHCGQFWEIQSQNGGMNFDPSGRVMDVEYLSMVLCILRATLMISSYRSVNALIRRGAD